MIVANPGAILTVVAQKVSSGYGNWNFEDERTCKNVTMDGTWGTTMTGTVFNPTTGAEGSFAACAALSALKQWFCLLSIPLLQATSHVLFAVTQNCGNPSIR